MATPLETSSMTTISTQGEARDPGRDLEKDLEKEETTRPSPLDGTTDPEKDNTQQGLPPDPNDWNGPDDPENPMNWNKWIRYYHIIPPALISFTG
jgi:hypothetical protein